MGHYLPQELALIRWRGDLIRGPARNRRAFFLWLAISSLAACGGEKPAPDNHGNAVIVATIADPSVAEASGLARSNLRDDRLWVINDGGSPPKLHAIGTDGSLRGSVFLSNAKNVDWEDLASFEKDGTAWLLVADIGDNEAKREYVTLYLLEEPQLDNGEIQMLPAIRPISFTYPDGPRDAEAVAVDVEANTVLILSKRDIPAALYSVPLDPASAELITATKLGEVASIPQPTEHDLERALPDQNWFWQPTGLDIARDGTVAVVLTYEGAYIFHRRGSGAWLSTLQARPERYELGDLREAEAIAFDGSGESIYVTVEQVAPPLLRIERKPSVTVMTFNVENLFDNSDDPGKDDKAFLAFDAKQTEEHKADCAEIEVDRWRDQCLNWDWSDAIIEKKLQVVADAILQVGNGRGPDVVALQEVENVAILERLRTEYLTDANYQPAILIEGHDARGIDVAFLSRLELAGPPSLHPIVFDEEFTDRAADTRGVLRADFVLPDESVLTGYSVHFPAPFHPTAMRVAAYEHLNELASSLPADRPVFAAGDFNTTSAEDGEEKLLDRLVRPYWAVSGDLCAGCRGTQYYAPDDSWSFLDMVLWRAGSGADATWELRKNSVHIANHTPDQVLPDGTPSRFQLPDGSGVSDHWPVVLTIELK